MVRTKWFLSFIMAYKSLYSFAAGMSYQMCIRDSHNPGVLFDETIMPYGAAVHAACAFNWLNRRNA